MLRRFLIEKRCHWTRALKRPYALLGVLTTRRLLLILADLIETQEAYRKKREVVPACKHRDVAMDFERGSVPFFSTEALCVLESVQQIS